MKVVIDIPEKMYTSLELGSFGMKYNVYDLAGCVMHGTPLPTGHGELKDTDNIKKEILCRKYSDSFCEEHHIDHSINTEIALSIIDNAPTIIDKEGEG